MLDVATTAAGVQPTWRSTLWELQGFEHLVLVAGRVFSKGRRDPRIASVWAKLPDGRRAHYESIEVLEPGVLGLFRRYRVVRVELSLQPWQRSWPANGVGLAVSLHLGYAWVSTARRCPTAQALGHGVRHGQRCSRPCTGGMLRLVNGAMQSELLLVGNAYHYQTEPPSSFGPADRCVVVGSPGELGGVPGATG